MNTQEDTSMDINQIMSIIPHRYPFLLIDRIKEIILGESIIGIKNISTYYRIFAAVTETRRVF